MSYKEITSGGVTQPADPERRIANDQQPYTWREFLDFYGEGVAENYWRDASCILEVGVRMLSRFTDRCDLRKADSDG